MSKKMEFDSASVDEALMRFGDYWKTLPEENRILAEKVTMLTAYAGGRKRAAEAMGIAPTTLDNYRSGKTQPKFLELLKLAEAAGHDFQYLVYGSDLQGWARKSIDDLRPSDNNAEKYPAEPDAGRDAARPTHGVDIVLLQRIGDQVRAIYVECKQAAPERAVIKEAGELYNEVVRTVPSISDTEMVEAVLPVLIGRFKERIMTAEPGSGKRSA